MERNIVNSVGVDTILQDEQPDKQRVQQIESNKEIQYFDYPGWFIKSNSREENNIHYDLRILEQMLLAIIDYENNQSTLKQALIIIGNLAGKISYNDLGDKASHYIRNQYGYLQRNNNKSINKNGIYFERLHHLRIIFSNDQISLSIPEEEINNLHSHLSCLKQKIAHILLEQNPWYRQQTILANIIIDFSAPISDIMDFSRKYYEQLLLQRINSEFDQLEIIDFSNKDDRYYFARAFCIIGELVVEWFEDRSIEEKKQVLMETFRHSITLRHQIIHHHRRVKFGMENQNQSINEFIVEIKKHFKQVIMNNRNILSLWEIDFSYTDAIEFRGIMEQLVNSFTGKSISVPTTTKQSPRKTQRKKDKSAKSEADNEIRKKLDRLVTRAWGIIDGTKSGVREKKNGETITPSIENQLIFLNNQYQRYLCELKTNDRNSYPLALDLMNLNIIKKFSESMVQNSSQFSDPNNAVVDKFVLKIQAMKEEVEYLLELNKISSIDELKKHSTKQKYIIQHIMNVIGQLVRDIEQINICKLLKTESPSDSHGKYLSSFDHFSRFSSSVLIREGKISSKELRNQGLAHNILCFNDDTFLEGLRDVESVYSQFKLYYNVIMKDTLPKSAVMFKFIGRSFFNIGLYEEAIEYLEKALALFRDHPCESEQATISDDLNTEFKNVFQMDLVVFQAYIDLMIAYFRAGDSKKTVEIGDLLINKFSLSKMENISNLMFEYICYFLCSLTFPLDVQGQCNKIIEIMEIIDIGNVNYDFKLHLAFLQHKFGNIVKAKALLNQVFQGSSDYKQHFTALTYYINIYLESENDESTKTKITNYIDQVEKLFEEHLYDFKSTLGDKYLENRINVIEMKLRLIVNNDFDNLIDIGLTESDIIRVKDLSKQFKNLIHMFKDSFFDNLDIVYLQLNFSYVYCSIYKSVDLSVENLREAKYYFDLVLETVERFPAKLFTLKTHITILGNMLCNEHAFLVMKDQSLNRETKIEYLLEIFSSQEKYHLKNVPVLNFLGEEFFLLGEEYLTEYYGSDKQEIACLALDNYNNAIKNYNLLLEYLHEEENSTYFFISIHTKIQLANCYSSIAVLKCELRLFEECMDYWNELLTLPLEETENLCVIECKEINEDTISEITATLIQILKSFEGNHQLQFYDDYIIRYLRKKFNIGIIQEKSVRRWIYRGVSSADELKNQIKQELKYSAKLKETI